jgi:rare lipoprotein A
MIRSMRSSARHSAVALALAGLVTSAPALGVSPAQGERIDALSAVVASLPENLVPVEVAASPEAQDSFEVIGSGEASYYGRELEGNRTASGERFDADALTAAHRTLPLGTKLRVTNEANGRSVVVRVNDRGPFVGRRVIDLSLAAAHKINMVRSGKARVTLARLRR